MKRLLTTILQLSPKQILRIWLAWYVVYAVYLASNLSKNPPIIPEGLWAFVVLLPASFAAIPTYLLRSPFALLGDLISKRAPLNIWSLSNKSWIYYLILLTSILLTPAVLNTTKYGRKVSWALATVVTALAAVYSVYALLA